MEQKISVMIVDDIPSIRQKYENIFAKTENIQVVATAGDGYDAVFKAVTSRPDVILMDIEMEDKMAGITATRKILKEFPHIKIIVLTVYDEDDLIFTAFQAGVCDYIQKTDPPASVVKSVVDAYHGKSPIRPAIANRIRHEFSRIRNDEQSLLYTIYLVQLLTETERKILILLYNGVTQQKICDTHHIEPSTLKTHLRNIKKKLGCHSVQDAVRKLEQSGFYAALDKMKENGLELS